jgi:hypothetical protein
MAVDYSIECAIPYVDEVQSERNRYLTVLGSLARHLDDTHKTHNRSLLVDDVTNDGGPSYNLDAYVDAVADAETTVFEESMLNGLADDVYTKLVDKLPPEDLAKLKNERGYSSPFYIAIWTLVQLGHLEHPDFPPDRVAERVFNILPADWQEGENESLAIIGKTEFADAAAHVDYTYL